MVGCIATSPANCCSAAADALLAYPTLVLWFGESRGFVVFDVDIDVMDVLYASPVPMCWLEECCRHSAILGGSGIGFAMALWKWYKPSM